jgi:ketosteroid isomerase-like protein
MAARLRAGVKTGEEVSVRFADVYQTEQGGIIKRETFFSKPAV